MPNFCVFCPKSHCHPRRAAAEPSSGTVRGKRGCLGAKRCGTGPGRVLGPGG